MLKMEEGIRKEMKVLKIRAKEYKKNNIYIQYHAYLKKGK